MNRITFFASFLCALCSVLDASVIETATTVPPDVQNILKKTNISEVESALNDSRRILNGYESLASRPYMVYLKLPMSNPKYKEYRRWLCGGIIVHEEYILTSAACIEDARNFYVVSGTYKHSENYDRHNNQCIKNGAKKAIWKCVPKNYMFDGHENDNIRWMNNDIAVVKVEEEFDFHRRVRGCDYVPRPICYNNQSDALEAPDTAAFTAGWGSTMKYNDWVNTRKFGSESEMNLLETPVHIIRKSKCKRRWGSRYYNIIDNYMICTKDVVPDMSVICDEKYVDCEDVTYSGEDDYNDGRARRRVISPNSTALRLHSAYHNETRRNKDQTSGGFCENDHGGPLIVGEGVNAVAIGIISACLVKDRTNKCYGPFLYTSIFRNRVLLNCAIYKDVAQDCNKVYRSSVTHTETVMSWVDHPDGPAKNEIPKPPVLRAGSIAIGSGSNASSDNNVTNPDTNGTHSDSKAARSDSNGPSSETIVPSSDSNVPNLGIKVPSPESNVPRSGSKVPSPESNVQSLKSIVPSSDSDVPSLDLKVPSPKSNVQSLKSNVPSPDAKVPSPGSNVPKSDSKVPSPESNVPRSDPNVPSSGSKVPSSEANGPSSNSKLPSPESNVPRSDSKVPSSEAKVPSPDSEAASSNSTSPHKTHDEGERREAGVKGLNVTASQ